MKIFTGVCEESVEDSANRRGLTAIVEVGEEALECSIGVVVRQQAFSNSKVRRLG
jgi:hypothetical protein